MFKNHLLRVALIGMIVAGIMQAGASQTFAELNGDQIVARVDEIIGSSTGRYIADITVVRPGKDERTSRVQVYIKGSEKVLVRYLAPAQEKGQGYLRIGDDEWLFLPSANKSLRVSGRQNMQGSDLANDDLLRIKLTTDYTAQLLGTESIAGVNHYLLELTARQPSVAYGKLKFWVRQEDFIPTRTEYYATSGKLIKIMTYNQIQMIGGKTRPTMMEIQRELRKGYKTIFHIVEADFTGENPDQLFTRLNLEKGK